MVDAGRDVEALSDGRRPDRTGRPVGRRTVLRAGALAGAGLLVPGALRAARAAEPDAERRHGLSAFGELKYPADFKHFAYVRSDAPKGGTFNFGPSNWVFNQNAETFNTLNSFVLKGDAPPRMEMCFDTLMTSALDEPDALYCHLAEWVSVSADGNLYTFGLREARFHDGTPVTAEDVAFSWRTAKEKGHPQLSFPLAEMIEARARDARTVEIRFSGRQSPHAMLASAASVPVFSKAYYASRPFDSSSLDVPLSSGPYRVGHFEAGRTIEYERVPDYWGAGLPTAVGLNNFDTIRIDFYAEREAAFEAFKKGAIDFHEEFTSKIWATGYDFPAIRQKKVIRGTFPEEKRPAMQAWALNQRHARFADPRVRQAIDLCFDFEWTNAKIFYNIYSRSQSLFERSDFKAEGPPDAAEEALLKGLKSPVPKEAFGPAVMQPVTDGSGHDRSLLKRAYDLLAAAGWKREGDALRKNGETLSIEVLIRASAFERLLSSFVENLRQLGIVATVRLVDPAQYQARIANFEFDMTALAVQFEATPTAESLGQFFSQRSADQPGSYNLPGVKAPVYDEILEDVKAARSREELVTAMRVLDRVLRARLDWIPNWYSANHLVAYWDRFGFVTPKPDYGWPVESLWWYDAQKAKAIGRT
ncbi:MAG: extracellular solute-binding protein [Pararhizobium sp.]